MSHVLRCNANYTSNSYTIVIPATIFSCAKQRRAVFRVPIYAQQDPYICLLVKRQKPMA
jgi:hypothetical protein